MKKREENYWLVLCLSTYAGVTAMIMGATPKFMRMYADMLAGEPLPLLTRLFCGIPTLGYAVTMVLGVVLGGMAHSTIQSANNRFRLRVFIVWVSLLLAVTCAFALLSPLFVSIDGRLG